MEPSLDVLPVTPDRWDDLVELFGERGAYSGCWCMFWRLTGREFGELAGRGTRRRLNGLVRSGRTPGLLGYLEGRPVGWCSVAPREEFGRLARSRVLGPVDDQPVWSVVCFYIDRRHRRSGVAAALLRAAVRHAAGRGARLVEGYPVDPKGGRVDSAQAYTGLASMFRAAGFEEVARRSPTRPVMRLRVG